jgi:hypothetical protein
MDETTSESLAGKTASGSFFFALFSSDLVLLVGGVVVFLVLLQAGVVATVGEWLGHMMTGGVRVP